MQPLRASGAWSSRFAAPRGRAARAGSRCAASLLRRTGCTSSTTRSARARRRPARCSGRSTRRAAHRGRGDAAPRAWKTCSSKSSAAPSQERDPHEHHAASSARCSQRRSGASCACPGRRCSRPLISTTLYFLVFGYSLGGRVHTVDGRARTCTSSSRAWCSWASPTTRSSTRSSSLFITKIQGTVVDLLVAPLGPPELLFGLHRRARWCAGWWWACSPGWWRRVHRLRAGAPAGDARVPAAGQLRLRDAGPARRALGGEVRADQLLPHLRDAAAHLPRRRLLLGAATCPRRGTPSACSTPWSTWWRACASACWAAPPSPRRGRRLLARCSPLATGVAYAAAAAPATS